MRIALPTIGKNLPALFSGAFVATLLFPGCIIGRFYICLAPYAVPFASYPAPIPGAASHFCRRIGGGYHSMNGISEAIACGLLPDASAW